MFSTKGYDHGSNYAGPATFCDVLTGKPRGVLSPGYVRTTPVQLGISKGVEKDLL